METLGQDLETMRRVPLAPDHVDAICAIGGEKFYPAGSIVMEIGEPMDRFVYILEGEIEVVDPYTDERMLPSSLGATQFMGEIAFLNRSTNIMRMRAAVDTRVIEAPRTPMLELMGRVPELSDHLITVFAARRRRQFEARNDAIKVIGADRDPAVQAVERFLSRNRIPFQSYDMDERDAETAAVCDLTGHKPSVILGFNQRIEDPTPRKVAQYLGMDLDICSRRTYDLVIVGGGPAGVAAAVYAGSEGIEALVVEDNLVNQTLAVALLKRLGIVATVVDNGARALEQLEARRWDIVLMDCQMPVMDGFEAVRRWREIEADRGLPRTPVIALTANAMEGDRERCLSCGMDDYLSKPIDRAALAEVMASRLG